LIKIALFLAYIHAHTDVYRHKYAYDKKNIYTP